MRRISAIAIAGLLLCAVVAQADNSITLAFLDIDKVLYGAIDQNTPDLGKVLDGGDQLTLGDGDLLEVYLDDDPGAGIILSLLSDDFTVGDDMSTFPAGTQHGRMSFTITLTSAEIGPHVGKQLYLRYYDNKTAGGSQFFGQLTAENWTVPQDAPDGAPATFSLTDPNVTGMLNSGGIGPGIPEGFYTNLAVPEPATILLVGIGLAGLFRRRR